MYLLRGSIENVQDIYAERAALLLKEDKEKVHICSWLWVARNLMIMFFWFFSSSVAIVCFAAAKLFNSVPEL